VIFSHFVLIINANSLALGAEADFEALYCLPALNFIGKTLLQLSNEPAFLPNAFYSQFLISIIQFLIYSSYSFNR